MLEYYAVGLDAAGEVSDLFPANVDPLGIEPVSMEIHLDAPEAGAEVQ